MGGAEDLREPPGLVPRGAFGYGHGRSVGDDGQFRLGTAAGDGHDPVPDRPAARARTQGDHPTGELHARNVDRGTWRCRVEPLALHEIGGVDSRGLHRHQELAAAGTGVRMLEPFEGAVDDGYGVHGPRVDRASSLHPAHPVQ